MNRRKLLRKIGFGIVASTSGCSSIKNDSPEVSISSIYVTNHDEEPHIVHLLIFDEESEEPMRPVYFRSRRFKGNDPSKKFDNPGGLFEGVPTDPGNYHIEVRLDQRRWDSVDVSSYSNLPENIKIGITIGYKFKEEGPPAWMVTVDEAGK